MAIRAYDTFDQGESRAMDARKANDRIAEKARRLHFLSRVPMVCECSDPACRTIVMIGLPEYHELRRDPDRILTAPGHDADRTETTKDTGSLRIQGRSRSCA